MLPRFCWARFLAKFAYFLLTNIGLSSSAFSFQLSNIPHIPAPSVRVESDRIFIVFTTFVLTTFLQPYLPHMRHLINLVILFLLAGHVSLAQQIESKEKGNLVMENIPEIPERISEKLLQYQNTRSAFRGRLDTRR